MWTADGSDPQNISDCVSFVDEKVADANPNS